MNSRKKTARTAGVLYLLLAITGFFSIMYVPSTLIVTGDATASASNITSSEMLFRFGILVSLITHVIFVFLVLALYRLLKEVSHSQAMLMVILVVISAATGFLNTINQVAALIILSGLDFLSVFDKDQLDALAYVFLRLHNYGLQANQMFWGLWLFPFGLLVFRSGFIPRIFGVFLIVAGIAYLISWFMFFVMPQYQDSVSPVILFFELWELPIIFWLLIVGAKEKKLNQPGRSAQTSCQVESDGD